MEARNENANNQDEIRDERGYVTAILLAILCRRDGADVELCIRFWQQLAQQAVIVGNSRFARRTLSGQSLCSAALSHVAYSVFLLWRGKSCTYSNTTAWK